MPKESSQWILSLTLSPKQSLHTTEPTSHFPLSTLTVLFPCNLFRSLQLVSLLILAIWKSWVPSWNHDGKIMISCSEYPTNPLALQKCLVRVLTFLQRKKSKIFTWRSMKTLYICSSPTALFNDLEDSGTGSTVETVASTDGRWHEEIRKRRERRLVGVRYGNQRAVCLQTASNSTNGFGNIMEGEENGWGSD